MNSIDSPIRFFMSLGLLFSLYAVGYTSPSPVDSTRFCQPLHFEQEERGRSAAKAVVDLNVGEPRTVRLVYFSPNDRPFRPEVDQKIKRTIRQVQTFYAEQMQAHSYGNKTFRIETDANGQPIVHRLQGQHADDHYLDDPFETVFAEIRQVFDTRENIYLAFVGASRFRQAAWRSGKNGGEASAGGDFPWNIVAHELGHAFGLEHDFRDGAYLMSYGSPMNQLSACAAEFLAVHPYFNLQISTEAGPGPTVEFTSPTEYPAGATNFSVQFKVSDPDGLHQIILLTTTHGYIGRSRAVKACRGLEGQEDTVVDLDFEEYAAAYLITYVFRPIYVRVIDTNGNVTHRVFYLVEIPPSQIAKLEGHASGVRSVSFSPEGTSLASGSLDGTVKLWDVETGTAIATFSGGHLVAFSPDGTILAFGSSDSGMALWDVATRQTIGTLGEHAGGITSLSFSPDGKVVASGSLDGTVKLWDVVTRETIATLEAHGGEVTSLSFSPDGKVVASGSLDGTVKLWDVVTRETIATLEGHGEEVTSLSFSPDGKVVASGSLDGTVKLWDVVTRETIATLEAHGGDVTSLSFSPDGKVVASGSLDRTVKLWDILTEEIFVTFGHTAAVSSVAFSADGTTLASGSGDGTVRLWDVAEWTDPRPRMLVKISGDSQQGTPGEELDSPFVVEVRDQNDNPLSGAEVTFRVTSGDGLIGGRFAVEKATTDADGRIERILTLGSIPGANTVEVSVAGLEHLVFNAVGVGTPSVSVPEGNYPTWHLPEAAIIRLARGRVGRSDRAVAYSPDGKIFAVASGVGLWLYDAATLDELSLLPMELVNSVSFSPDGTTLALGSGGGGGGGLTLWDVATGSLKATLGARARVKYVSFSPDGKILASGTSTSRIELWDVGTETHITTLRGQTSPGTSVSFSPDGRTLASGEEDGTVRLWDIETRTNIATLEGHSRNVESVSFSPDGTTVASASSDGTVRLWDAATGTESRIIRAGMTRLLSVSFSPDGASLASGAWNGSVKLWSRATGGTISTFPPHSGRVWSVSFSPDGKTLASASEDGPVNLWDLASESAVSLSGYSDVIFHMAFSPGGATLASSASTLEGMVNLWDVATGRKFATLSGHERGIRSVSFSSDGTTFASGSSDRTLRLWDLETRTTIATLDHGHSVIALSFSPDGRVLASGDADGYVNLWQVETREKIATLTGHRRAVTAVLFSPDGESVASGSYAGGVRVWDVATGNTTAMFEGHKYPISSLSFSPDGATLISGTGQPGDYQIKKWDLATGTEVGTLEGDIIEALSFSPDGTMFATGSQDNKVRLVDLATGATVATLKGHGHFISEVLFSPDGSLLASASHDGSILLWDMRLALPHPRTLTKIAGDNQQGPAGNQLTNPIVVSVLDQNGSPFDGAEVTFAVTAGDGSLSVERAMSDRSGRASTTLTLGRTPGPNTVEVRVNGVEPVTFTVVGIAIPQAFTKFSGEGQQGPAGVSLTEPFVVEVRDQNGNPLAGAQVTFAIASGGGTLSTTTATTDSSGRASSTLTLGRGSGTNTVEVTVAELEPVIFSALAETSTDFDGDGVTNFADFFLFADAFGGTDARFDLDGSGVVDFGDFFIFADAFGQPARAKLLALAAKLIGLPEGPQLQQNAPNPFNSQTVIPYFLLAPGHARLEVYALTGQRVAVLHQGPQPAGLHRIHWAGLGVEGRPLASGIYLYRLVTAEGALTRKLVLLR